MRTLIQRSLVLFALLLLMASTSAQAADCEFRLGFATLRDLIGHEIVGECLENEHYNEIGDSNQQTTGGLMAWRKADNWTAFTDGYRTWLNGPNGLVVRLNTERFEWEADYAEIVLGVKPTPTPVPPPPWPGVSTVPVGVPHRFMYDGETWEVTVLEVLRGQAVADRANLRKNSTFSYSPPLQGQEDVAIKYTVKLLGLSKLGATRGIFDYHLCISSYLATRCTGFHPTDLIMESGDKGEPHLYPDYVGNLMERKPFLSIGESEVGWEVWTVWEGAKVVFVVHMDDDQDDFSEYSAVFALN